MRTRHRHRPPPTNLDQLLELLADISLRVHLGITEVAGHIWWPPTRRMLMSLKTDIQAELDKAMAGVRREKDIKAAMTSAMTALQAQSQALIDRIAELEATPGDWTNADLQEIKDQVVAINAAQDPEVVVEAVVANTPSEGTGETAGNGNAG